MAGNAYTKSALIVAVHGATPTTIATCPGPGPWRVTGIYIAGDETNARTVTIHFVPSGDTAGDANRFGALWPIPANDTLDLELSSPVYLHTNDTVQMTADVTNALTAFVSLKEL